MTNGPKKNRFRVVAGSTLIYLVGIALIGTSFLKFAHPPAVLAQFRELGYEGSKLTLIGILEVSCALLFMVPPTRSIGVLLISSYLGGAIATHVGHGQPAAFGPAVLLALAWLGAWLRHPYILWSFESQEGDPWLCLPAGAWDPTKWPPQFRFRARRP